MQATNPPTVNGIATTRTLRTLATDLAEPPLGDLDAFYAIHDECYETLAREVREAIQ